MDFYCAEYWLVIEIDGAVHEQQPDYDAARTRRLEALGYKVLRFSNEDVMVDLENVLTQIKASLAG